MNEDELRSALYLKKIIFIDDERLTTHYRIEKLKRNGADVAKTQSSLDMAYRHFEEIRNNGSDEPPYNVVILDLKMPPVPDVLRRYERKLGSVSTNHGQTMGLYLDDKFPKQLYIYLSAVSSAFNSETDQGPGCLGVLDKFENSADEFPEQLARIMGWVECH